MWLLVSLSQPPTERRSIYIITEKPEVRSHAEAPGMSLRVVVVVVVILFQGLHRPHRRTQDQQALLLPVNFIIIFKSGNTWWSKPDLKNSRWHSVQDV